MEVVVVFLDVGVPACAFGRDHGVELVSEICHWRTLREGEKEEQDVNKHQQYSLDAQEDSVSHVAIPKNAHK